MSMTYSDLSNEDVKSLYDSFIPDELHHGYYPYRGYVHTLLYEEIKDSVERLDVLDSDIWVSSVPKSGTTWLSETVWSICNDLNAPEAKQPLNERVRFLEYSALFKFDADVNAPAEVTNSVEKVLSMPSPRIIKTHLPWECLPDQIRHFAKRPRVIHVARDPRDVAVSFFHHNKLFRGYAGPSELFYEMFLRGLMRWSPYQDNVMSYWSKRDESNVLFLRFEEMKHDLSGVIAKIGRFLNVEVDDRKMAELLEHLSFKNMKRNDDLRVDDVVKYINDRYLHEEKSGEFLRKGEAGAHRDEMSDEMAERFDNVFTYGQLCK